MSSLEVIAALEKGIRRACPYAEIIKIPVADGGEGFCGSVCSAFGGEYVKTAAKNALFEDMESDFLSLDGKTAVIELAKTAGLTVIPETGRNPLLTTTFGVGMQIKEAVLKGFSAIILGLGGSATNDGGAGLANALGAEFYDEKGRKIFPSGGNLGEIAYIDTGGLLKEARDIKFALACDVKNRLCGKNGAARVFAAQKGADADGIRLLDKNLSHFADMLEKTTGKAVRDAPGTGAAGGAPLIFLSLFDAEIKSGIDIILDIAGFDKKAENADLIITGEGSLDAQSAFGKAVSGIGRRAGRAKVIAVCGSADITDAELEAMNIKAAYPIKTRGMDLNFAVKNAAVLIEGKIAEILPSLFP